MMEAQRNFKLDKSELKRQSTLVQENENSNEFQYQEQLNDPDRTESRDFNKSFSDAQSSNSFKMSSKDGFY